MDGGASLINSDPSVLIRLAQIARRYFEGQSCDKIRGLHSIASVEEDIPVRKVGAIYKRLSIILRGSEDGAVKTMDPEAYAAVLAASGWVMSGGRRLLDHPDVVAFRKRVMTKYRPPSKSRIALFVPCSKTKPYRHSLTHRGIDEVIREVATARNLPCSIVDLLVISEPIGVVPRRWDLRYPAMNYNMTLPAWVPLDKTNNLALNGDARLSVFSRLAEMGPHAASQSETAVIVARLSDIVAEFLKLHCQEYDVLLGYVRGTHRLVLKNACQKTGAKIEMIPTKAEIARIIKNNGRLHWTFQGLRGKPARQSLARHLTQCIDTLL